MASLLQLQQVTLDCTLDEHCQANTAQMSVLLNASSLQQMIAILLPPLELPVT